MGRTDSKTRKRRDGIVLKVRKTRDRSKSVDGRQAVAKPITYKCMGCNYRVPYLNTYCGECLCEEDGI